MKKLSLFAVVAAFVMIGFSSCEDAIVSTPLSVDTTMSIYKATVSGYVTANMNLQAVGEEAVPATTTLLIEVNYADLNTVGNALTGKWDTTITVTNGQYSIVVPADADGANVTITPFPFEASQTQPVDAQNETITKEFTTAPVTLVAVKTGEIRTCDFSYVAALLPLYDAMVTVTGIVTANLDENVIGEENVPNGTRITFSNGSDWEEVVTVTGGAYTVDVPQGDAITWDGEFTYNKNVWNATDLAFETVSYDYTVSGSSPGFNTPKDGEDNDITVDNGDVTDTPTPVEIASIELTGTVTGAVAGDVIYFSTSDWAGSVTLGGTLTYTIDVPANSAVSIDIDLDDYAGTTPNTTLTVESDKLQNITVW